ncbi:uncharacterized protein LOC126844943 isoform X2 [Adelges cooleyi]|uniref:uncharacterized protein LOC126844943 isoform X2 n=1 Tax=Adelges cooleyi TaxID=133065 RepID=UPI002180388A|nr:uncharacterized protein LOC126844943 isoform X2 [Adelges cooleyi]
MVSLWYGRRRPFSSTSLLPFVLGFAVGALLAYLLFTITTQDNNVKNVLTKLKFNKQRQYHRDTDDVLAQRNAWREDNRCNKIVYMGRKNLYLTEDSVDWLFTTDKEVRWRRYCHALKTIYRGYSGQYRWLFVTVDQTWLIHNNIIRLINALDTEGKLPYYTGMYITDKEGRKLLDANSSLLLSWTALQLLVHIIGTSCDEGDSNNVNKMLDGYLQSLDDSLMAVENMDENGCTLFHNLRLNRIFDPTRVRFKEEKCISNHAVTFGMDPIGLQMFYLYSSRHLRVVGISDLNVTNILPSQGDDNEWLAEARYELQDGPVQADIEQEEFNARWVEKRKIIL